MENILEHQSARTIDLIKQGLAQDERLQRLNAEAIQQITRLLDLKSVSTHVKELEAGQ